MRLPTGRWRKKRCRKRSRSAVTTKAAQKRCCPLSSSGFYLDFGKIGPTSGFWPAGASAHTTLCQMPGPWRPLAPPCDREAKAPRHTWQTVLGHPWQHCSLDLLCRDAPPGFFSLTAQQPFHPEKSSLCTNARLANLTSPPLPKALSNSGAGILRSRLAAELGAVRRLRRVLEHSRLTLGLPLSGGAPICKPAHFLPPRKVFAGAFSDGSDGSIHSLSVCW
jgi:hypothetical protein